MKVLSVIIPAYNTELYLGRCLDSLLYNEDVVKYLDIIVVDDGSVDGTAKLADKYRTLYPKSISVVRKENGGHGSAVNAGVKKAVGKYLRILDSDDWVNIDDFAKYVENLTFEEADIVVTNVRRQQLYDTSEWDFVFCTERKPVQKIEEVVGKIDEDNFFFEFSMHSMAVRTETLKKVWGEGLLEKTFYVDQQFVAKVFMCAKSFVEYPLSIYMYFIGRPEQSMGTGFFKHIDDHERVLRWLLNALENDDLPDYYKKIVARQVVLMLGTHYRAFAEQRKLGEEQKKKIMDFDEFLKTKYPEYYEKAGVGVILKQIVSPLKKNKLGRTLLYFKGGKA